VFKIKASSLAQLLADVNGITVEINKDTPRMGAFVVKVCAYRHMQADEKLPSCIYDCIGCNCL
jgi:hypothetical protein